MLQSDWKFCLWKKTNKTLYSYTFYRKKRKIMHKYAKISNKYAKSHLLFLDTEAMF